MKVSTLSIVCGTDACNASCPYCISKITGTENIPKIPTINYVRFKKACQLAENSGATTVLLTGKGEPTLYMDQIFYFLNELNKYSLPIIELQTLTDARSPILVTLEANPKHSYINETTSWW